MAKTHYLKAGAVATIAAMLALAATPSTAMAQDGRQGRDGAAAQSQSRPAWRGGGEARQQRARPAERAAPQQRAAPQRARPEARSESGGAPAWRARGRDGETARSVRQQDQQRPERRPVTPPQTRNPNFGEAQRNRPDRNTNWNRPETNRPGVVRNNDRRDDNRNGWQNNRRNGNWNDQNRNPNRNAWKDGRRDEPSRVTPPRRDDDRRWSYSNGRYNWNRDWRNDRRYDWNDHRRSNRNVYNIGRYRSPYTSYYYRPLSIGYRLNAPFYGNSYWISDPWDYRLPQAYGPYRWVRYFDDVLLVNIQNGAVVDVIRDFFW